MEEDIDFPQLILILLVIVFFVALEISTMTSFRNTSINPTIDAEIAVYHNVFLNSPECFAYQDPLTGRIYNEIDLSKFDEFHLSKCVDSAEGNELNYGVRLTLRDDEKTLKQISKNMNTNWKARRTSSSVIVRGSDSSRKIAELVTEVWFRQPVGVV